MRRRLVLAVLVAAFLLAAAPGALAQKEESPGAGQRSEFMGRIVPEESKARFPLNRYDIGYDPGAWNDFNRKILGFTTDILFSVARWLVAAGSWVITWAFTFGFAKELARPAAEMGRVYEARLIGPLGLFHAALFAAAAWAGWQLLRGRLARGAGEFGLSLLVLLVGAFLLRDPAGMIGGALERTGQLSGELLAVATSSDVGAAPRPSEDLGQPQYGRLLDPLKAALAKAFVDDPYDLLSWGEVIGEGRCAEIRDEILREGPWGTDDRPRDMMAEEERCRPLAEFNGEPSADRLFGALLLMVAALVTLVLLMLVAGTVVAAQLLVIGLIALAGFALIGGILPGSGRQMMWRWLAAGGRALLAVIGVSFLLAFMVVSVRALLAATEGQSLMERFGLLIVLVALMFAARKRLLRAGRTWASSLGKKMEVRGHHGPSGAAAAALVAAGALGLAGASRDGQQAVRTAATGGISWAPWSPGARSEGPGNRRLGLTVAPAPAPEGGTPGGNGHLAALPARMGTLALQVAANAPAPGPRPAARITLRAQEVRSRLASRVHRAGDWARESRHGAGHAVRGFWREAGAAPPSAAGSARRG